MRITGSCWYTPSYSVLFFLSLLERERERERERAREQGGAEREGDRTWSRLQAPSCQHRAPCWAWTHERWDHDLSWSQTLNPLSHTGAPVCPFLKGTKALSISFFFLFFFFFSIIHFYVSPRHTPLPRKHLTHKEQQGDLRLHASMENVYYNWSLTFSFNPMAFAHISR